MFADLNSFPGKDVTSTFKKPQINNYTWCTTLLLFKK